MVKGHTFEVIGFAGSSHFQGRLQELGLHVGAALEYMGQAPFRGPHLIRMGTVVLALRDEEVQCLRVKDISTS